MGDKLVFNPDNYRVETLEIKGRTLVYRAYEDLVYVEKPVAPEYQKMNIYVPEAYFKGESINGYGRNTAPVFLANTVGGYMPGKPEGPGPNFMGKTNALFLRWRMVMWRYLREQEGGGLSVRMEGTWAVPRPVLWT